MKAMECSMCRRPAAWLIDAEVFPEGHKERIIEAAGVDRFKIRRLTEAKRNLQCGGRISQSVAAKKEAQAANGQTARPSR